MYFYVLCALMLAKTAESGDSSISSCDKSKWDAADELFNSLSLNLMDLDTNAQDICKQFPSFAAREVFGNYSYRLEVHLPQFTIGTFLVRIKHRVVYINAHHPKRGDKVCDLTYVDIKILPEFVDTHGAAWTYHNGTLFVAFPYLHKIKDYSSSCRSQYIDQTLLVPRKGFPNERIFTDS